MTDDTGGRVTRVAFADLRTSHAAWDYAAHNIDDIDHHWQRASAANPNFFNGVIYLTDGFELRGDGLSVSLIKTDFKSFLFWRDRGFPREARVRDGFGSALIRSAEGDIILGQQRPGNINAGLTYLPGGFIDQRDVRDDGSVDIKSSVVREVAEETGLGKDDLQPQPGFIITQAGPQISIAVEFHSHLPAQILLDKIARHIARESDPELAGMTIVRKREELDQLAMPPYARVLLCELLAEA